MYLKDILNAMKLLILFSIFVAICILWVSYMYYKITISKQLVSKAVPFTISGSDYKKTLLILGDSTAVGVGASTSSDSVGGRLATYLEATYVENHAVSGAKVEDLEQQINSISRADYDTILVQIGANDMVSLHKPKEVTAELKKLLVPLSVKTKQLIFISAGNLGGAPLIPLFLRPVYTNLNLKYHIEFESLGKELGITYINMYVPPAKDPFILNPRDHFAADDFHPSSLGYGVWFTIIQDALTKK